MLRQGVNNMPSYNVVAATDRYTVMSEYTRTTRGSEAYQSEADLEKEFIRLLTEQGYEFVEIHDEATLISNLRTQLEKLNGITFTDNEWSCIFDTYIASSNEGIEEKTNRIQEDYVFSLHRDDGSIFNVRLIDKKDIHNNILQVIHQYAVSNGAAKNRYDVTILVNGLPLIHVELKRRGVPIREAFNQINRYQRDSFWAGRRLFQYVQIFVISNGVDTKYYSNSTRENHIREMTLDGRIHSKKTSNSFEYTIYWADGKNNIIPDLVDFTKTFFARNTILNILTRYCVFTSEKMLLVMRPYQIAATERIINRIEISTNYKKTGTIKAGGYIWHTTGSGKTLTSFKTAQLASRLPYIDKVLFVVDRKDLDYQTMKEYDRFEKGAANGNTSTKILTAQLSDPNCKIIITTIQKLENFIKGNKGHKVFNEHVVLIFDECHRSQFGEMHTQITRTFRNYHLFGFTGTPIFAQNSGSSGYPELRTTEQAFGDLLHSYTIVNAINDHNVLPFLIDYVSTVKANDNMKDENVPGIETEKIMGNPKRIQKVVSYILEHFAQKTKRSESYEARGTRLNGFNSILAVSSIPMAMKYYDEMNLQLKERGMDLKIAVIYSYNPNAEDECGIINEGSLTMDGLEADARAFEEHAIRIYNKMFKCNFSTEGNGFENYYKDVSQRMKNRELDLLIVVNMFLTGFDATTLNTLWVDKNLKQHGLIQAFSRTNRILNTVKTYGNIVCFRNLRKATDEAIALFGDEKAAGIVILKTFDEYYNGYENDNGEHVKGYRDLVNELLAEYPIERRLEGKKDERSFIKLFNSILRLTNILMSFDQFAGKEILTPRQIQDYQGRYLDLKDEYRGRHKEEKEDVSDDIVFEVELVRQQEIDIDYILQKVREYHEKNARDKEILVDIERAISSSMELRSKRELILDFINRVDPGSDVDVDEEWKRFVKERRKAELKEMIDDYNLNSEKTQRFIRNSFRDGEIRTTGTGIDEIMPPVSRFGKVDRDALKGDIIDAVKRYFERYYGLE